MFLLCYYHITIFIFIISGSTSSCSMLFVYYLSSSVTWSMLVSSNILFPYLGWGECGVGGSQNGVMLQLRSRGTLPVFLWEKYWIKIYSFSCNSSLVILFCFIFLNAVRIWKAIMHKTRIPERHPFWVLAMATLQQFGMLVSTPTFLWGWNSWCCLFSYLYVSLQRLRWWMG